MSDERYKDGIQEHLKDFGFDPYGDHVWSDKRIKGEQKRLSLIALVPIIFAALFVLIQSSFAGVQYSPEAWNFSSLNATGALFMFSIFVLIQYYSFRRVKSPGKRFLNKWIPYLQASMRRLWIFHTGMALGVLSLINLTYDDKGGPLLKIGMIVLVYCAGYMLVRYLLIQPYKMYLREAESRTQNDT